MHDAFLHPFASPAKPESAYIRHIVRAAGATVWDADGNQYIDGLANLWNCHVGHGRDEIIDAVADQLCRVDCYNTFDPFGNEIAVAAAEAIRRHSPPPDGRVFLGCSGSDAIDTALKLVRATWANGRGTPTARSMVKRTAATTGPTSAAPACRASRPIASDGASSCRPSSRSPRTTSKRCPSCSPSRASASPPC